MKVNAVVFSAKSFLIKDKGLLSTFITMFTGVLVGVFIYAFLLNNTENVFFDLFISFNTDYISKSNIEIFSGILFNGLVYYLILFLSGTSFLGRYICITATFMKVVGITTLISYLYIQYGLKGLEYVLLVFFPGKAVLLLAAVIMTKNSYDMSRVVNNVIIEKGSTTSMKKLYYFKSLVFSFLFILSALIDFLALKIFSGLFDFTAL